MTQHNEIKQKNFIGILKESRTLYTRYWFHFILISLIFLIPTLLTILFFLFNAPFWNFIINTFSFLFYYISFWLLVSVALFYSLLSIMAFVKFLDSAHRDQTLGIFEAYKEALRQYGSLLSVYGLFTGKIFLWGLLLILPGIYFGILYNFAPLAVLVDNKKGMEALNFSRSLVRPNIIKYLDYILLSFGSVALICIPFFVCLDFVVKWALSRQYSWLVHSGGILEFFVLLTAGHFLMVFYYFVYCEFKNRIRLDSK